MSAWQDLLYLLFGSGRGAPTDGAVGLDKRRAAGANKRYATHGWLR